MAAQCRSPRCTAERKGFRRELDSWRHRLIHCVGFESILEGLYGSGLRRDLSLFDDCEPEELVDWCVDEKCSLCSLHKEIIDSPPSDVSTQSTPTEEVISQGQCNTEKTACQAENFLNALFQKKDLPQNCDPNIPLVAQELMKKMIRQFAIEYVSKSRKMYQDNGTMAYSPLGCNGFQLNQSETLQEEDQDSPLDLTVTRIQEHSFQDDDGALDLSLKRNGSGIDKNLQIKNLGVLNGYFLRKMKTTTNSRERNSILSKVLALYCQYHRQKLALILKFIREERKRCSLNCYGHLENFKPAKSKRSTKSPAACVCCAKEKLCQQVSLNKHTKNSRFPCVSVQLKDLRRTLPNLTLETVKVNPVKDVDLHISSSDQVLHCINTRSKKKKLLINSSNKYRSVSCSSSFPRLKLQRVDRNIVECDLQYCIKSSSDSSVKNQSCQTTSRTSKTANESSDQKKTSCDIVKKQNCLKPTKNIVATPESSRYRSKIKSVRFGSVLKHLLKNPKANDFSDLLNQDINTGVQTRFRKNKEKQLLFDGSLSTSQSLESSNNMRYTISRNDSQNSTEHIAQATASKKDDDILVINHSETTQTVSASWENEKELPHSKLSLCSRNVHCSKVSQSGLPLLARKNISNPRKRLSHPDTFVQSAIPFKRSSKNIFGKCKFCDVSHVLGSEPRNGNLFCKCTIKHNSGIFMNFGRFSRYTTGKMGKSHLKVMVKRLEDNVRSRTKTLDLQEKEKTENSNISKDPQESTLECKKYPFRARRSLSRRIAVQRNQSDSTVFSTSMSASLDEVSKTNLYSPIKLMFVSKVKTEDGEKYALSSVCTRSERNGDGQTLSLLDETFNHTHKKNTSFYCSSQSETTALSQCEDNLDKLNNVDNCPLRSSGRFVIKKIRSINNENETLTKNDQKRQFLPTCVTHSQFSDNLETPSTTKTYVAKNISCTQIKIKLQKLPESFIISDMVNGFSGEQTIPQEDAPQHTMPQKVSSQHTILQKDASQHTMTQKEVSRVSTRLQTLGKSSRFNRFYGVTDCNSKQDIKRTQDAVSEVPQKIVGEEDELESTQLEQCTNQKTKLEKLKIPKSPLIRKRTVSDYFTRSRKSSSVSLCFHSPSKSSRCALLQKSRKQHSDKSRHYRQKLRSSMQQPKPPLLSKPSAENLEQSSECSGENKDQSPVSAADCDLLLSPKWWSTETSYENLLNHLERRYEHLANTWVVKNKSDDDIQSSANLKSPTSGIGSPIQMLFKKKCSMKDLTGWLMQTTETQSLSIVRRSNACKAHQTLFKKGSTKRTKHPKVTTSTTANSIQSRQANKSDVPEAELHRISKCVNAESFSLKLRKRKHDNDMNKNSVQMSNIKDFLHTRSGKILNVSETCTTKVSDVKLPTKQTVHSVKKPVKNATDRGIVPDYTPVVDTASKEMHFCKQMEVFSENKSKKSDSIYYSNKKNSKDCILFLKRLGETSLSCSHQKSANGTSMPTMKPCLRLSTKFNNLNHSKPFVKDQGMINNNPSKMQMCLRKLRRTVVWYNGHSSGSGPEKRKPYSTIASFLERSERSPRIRQPLRGKMQSDTPKLQIGPVKPVGFPATRGLSSKFGSYSFTPIRIT